MAARGTGGWRLAAWGEPCQLETVTVPIYAGGPKVQVRRELRDALLQLGAVFLRHGYVVRRIGGYNCRRITGGTTMSSHAWGLSIDVNDDTNPYRTDRLITDMPPAMVAEACAIRTAGGVLVWRWGGNWDGDPATPHSNYDAMHWECIASPAELARGFLATVPVKADTAESVPVRAWPVIRHGSKGPAVLMLQSILGLDRVSGAGTFGPRTEAAVKLYQASRGLDVDGIVGLATWTAMLTNQPPHVDGFPRPQRVA